MLDLFNGLLSLLASIKSLIPWRKKLKLKLEEINDYADGFWVQIVPNAPPPPTRRKVKVWVENTTETSVNIKGFAVRLGKSFQDVRSERASTTVKLPGPLASGQGAHYLLDFQDLSKGADKNDRVVVVAITMLGDRESLGRIKLKQKGEE